jgi:hypothetical protein
MKTYIGTKILNAKPMTRGAYNVLREWVLPDNEDGRDEGYLVEYIDGGKANHPDFAGYVSWSPKEQFESAHLPMGQVSRMWPHQRRIIAEKVQLDDKLSKLRTFLDSARLNATCDIAERERLRAQAGIMASYADILDERISAFSTAI